jgi:hypothetical protein
MLGDRFEELDLARPDPPIRSEIDTDAQAGHHSPRAVRTVLSVCADEDEAGSWEPSPADASPL